MSAEELRDCCLLIMANKQDLPSAMTVCELTKTLDLPQLPQTCSWCKYTSVKIIKNEVRCRDDTVPKTVDTRRHFKVGLKACNLLQPPKNQDVGMGLRKIVACSQPYLAVPSCIYSFWYSVIPTTYLVHVRNGVKYTSGDFWSSQSCLLRVQIVCLHQRIEYERYRSSLV